MNIQRYKIANLLNYQIDLLKNILDEQTMTVIANNQQPHFSDAYVGLNPTEVEVLSELGFPLIKHISIGLGVGDLS